MATVSLSTTGYGDIVPVTLSARAIHSLLIAPMWVLFLIVLIGTTVETLATTTREQFRVNRWRKTLRNHTVVVGYGFKGRSAVTTLIDNGVSQDQIVVIDPDPVAANKATDKGLTTVAGDATRLEILRRAMVPEAKRVLVTTDRDDTNVLVTLTARQLNGNAEVSVAVREAAAHSQDREVTHWSQYQLLRGAHAVIRPMSTSANELLP